MIALDRKKPTEYTCYHTTALIKPKHHACFQACEIRSCGNSPLITFASEIAASLQQQQQQQQ